MKRFRKIYLEISNICNLNCAFCPGTKRPLDRLSVDEFSFLIPKLRPYSDFIYFHLMGEPLCHPNLGDFLEIAGNAGFKVILTTNGTLIDKQDKLLLNAPALHKINISLHAFEANDLTVPFDDYLSHCFSFGKSSNGSKLVVYRLWNSGGADTRNEHILDVMHQFYPGTWIRERLGTRIADRTYLEYGEKFDWPDLNAEIQSSPSEHNAFCYGLRDQIGILCDGSVVPCCLDHEGDLVLGNLFTQDLEEILTSSRAQNLYNGFSNRTAAEELCRRCGYAQRFSGK